MLRVPSQWASICAENRGVAWIRPGDGAGVIVYICRRWMDGWRDVGANEKSCTFPTYRHFRRNWRGGFWPVLTFICKLTPPLPWLQSLLKTPQRLLVRNDIFIRQWSFVLSGLNFATFINYKYYQTYVYMIEYIDDANIRWIIIFNLENSRIFIHSILEYSAIQFLVIWSEYFLATDYKLGISIVPSN